MLHQKKQNPIPAEDVIQDGIHDISQDHALNGSLSINPDSIQADNNGLSYFKQHIVANSGNYFIAIILIILSLLLVDISFNYLRVRDHQYFERQIDQIEITIPVDSSPETQNFSNLPKYQNQLLGDQKLGQQLSQSSEQAQNIPIFKSIQRVAQSSDDSLKQDSKKKKTVFVQKIPFSDTTQDQQTNIMTKVPFEIQRDNKEEQQFNSTNNKIEGTIPNLNLNLKGSSISKRQQELLINFDLMRQPQIQDQVTFQQTPFFQSPTHFEAFPETIPSASNSVRLNRRAFSISNFTGITVSQRDQAVNWLQLKNLDIQTNNQLADQERSYYEQKYQISKYSELPFCIVIPSYNNNVEGRHLNNIRSILMQEYTNYHIIFIDDFSTDDTGLQVSAFLRKQKKLKEDQWIVVRNTKQMHALPNLIMAASTICQPQDIFLIVDGDDELIGRQVLKLYNSVFQSKGVWFLYSNFLDPNGFIGYSRPIPQQIIDDNQYRIYPFVTSHLRAFYTQLFRNIKDQDLKDIHGNYLKAANDVAICLPILEQAQDRVAYIPQLTYLYNMDTGINNHNIRLNEQKYNDVLLREKQPYSRISTLYEKQ